MSVFALLAAAASLSPAAALEEFDLYCSRLDNIEAIAERVTTAGWQPTTLEPGSVLARQLEMQASFRSNLPTSFQARTFVRSDDAKAFLVLFRREVGDRITLECQLHFPEADVPPADEDLRAWSNRRPSRSVEEGGQRVRWWEPGLKESHTATGVAFIAADSPVKDMLPVAGLTITGRRIVTSN